MESIIEPATWLEARRLGITATDAPKILGHSAYGGPWTVWADKLNELLPTAASERMERGTRFEPFVLAEYALKHNAEILEVWPVGTRVRVFNEDPPRSLVQHRTIDWLLATPDGLASKDGRFGLGIIEAKTANEFVLGPWKSGSAPVGYKIQLQHLLAVSGLKWGALACLGGDFELYVLEMERDEAFIAWMLPRLEAFWRDHVLTGIPPKPTAGDLSRVRERYTGTEDAQKVLDESLAQVDARRLAMQKLMETTETTLEATEAEIRAALGDSRSGQIKNTTVVYSLTPSGKLRRDEMKLRRKR